MPRVLKDADKGGQVICGRIHMSTIPAFSYDLIEGKNEQSVTNLIRNDGIDFFELLKDTPI
jgi:propanol-preferring alcohol dehydrogenase